MSPGRTTRLLLALLLLAGAALPALVALPAAAAQRAAGALTVTTLDPLVGTPGARLHATGRLRNTGDLRLTSVEVRLRLSRTPLSSRAELAAVAAGRTDARQGTVVASQRLPGRLERGGELAYDLGVAVDDVPALRGFGVHVLTLEAVATSSTGVGRVAVVRTFLPWVPRRADFRPAGFTWLWPVGAAPRRLTGELYVDDGLAEELAPEGRLGRLVAAGQQLGQRLPLAWVVDPAVLDEARDMSGGYAVVGPDGGRVDGAGAEAAGRWLGELQSAVTGHEVVALPFGDPDLVGLRRNGITADVTRARLDGDLTTRDVLGVAPVTDLAWPADGFVDRATLQALRTDGMGSVLLRSDAVPPKLDLSSTPAGRADLRTAAGTTRAVLYDPVLARAVAPAAGAPALLAAQRFLAETAMITAERPSVGTERTIVVAPPRRWSPSPELLDRLVQASLAAPWMSGVRLDDLLSAAPPELDRAALRYPRSVRARELSRPYVTALRDVTAGIATFASVLTEPEQLVPELDRSVYRLESTWWRGRQQRADRLFRVRTELGELRAQIKVLPGSYTFGSRSGIIPVTVANGLDQTVSVQVVLAPRVPKIRTGPVDAVPVGPGRKVQVPVPAQAVASGLVFVQAGLLTPTGQPYSEPVELKIRITQYGTVALYVTMAAAAVLLLAGGVRTARRAMGQRDRAAVQP